MRASLWNILSHYRPPRRPCAGDASRFSLVAIGAAPPAGGAPPPLVALRVLLVVATSPSTIPLPGPPPVPGALHRTVHCVSKAVPAAWSLLEAVQAAVGPRWAGDVASRGGNEGGALAAVVQGVCAVEEAPAMLAARVGEVAAACAHPDGFLYVSLRDRRV